VSDLLNPANYGIQVTGFSRMRLPEIRQTIINDLNARTGVTFETRPDSITGQFIDTFAEREATLWELAEAVYHAMYPISAVGTNLDHAVSFSGVRRMFAEKSSVLAIMYGTEGTIVPSGAFVREANLGLTLYLADPATTITKAKASDVTVIIDTATAGLVYSVQVASVTYSYTAVAGNDVFAITAALAQKLVTAPVYVTTNSNTIRMYVLESFKFQFAIISNVRLVTLGTSGTFVAEEFGPLELPIGSVTGIISTQTGWNSVNNIVPGYTGRDDETDDELRLRYNLGVFQLGGATVNSIYANILQNVPGIIALKVYDNVGDVADADGRVPHCIEVVSWGGDAQQIADEIWVQKAAGIDTFGSVTVTVKDSQGYTHPIKFNRPVQVYMWVNVSVKLYSKELYPPTGNDIIKAVIALDGNTLGINTDVIVQRLVAAVIAEVPGIEVLTITLAGSTDATHIPAPGEYLGTTFTIGPRQLSRFDVARITVVIP
jgi:uncharacterized phage protein gp47/JayE